MQEAIANENESGMDDGGRQSDSKISGLSFFQTLSDSEEIFSSINKTSEYATINTSEFYTGKLIFEEAKNITTLETDSPPDLDHHP